MPCTQVRGVLGQRKTRRGVAMVFDKYLQTDRTRARFSKII